MKNWEVIAPVVVILENCDRDEQGAAERVKALLSLLNLEVLDEFIEVNEIEIEEDEEWPSISG